MLCVEIFGDHETRLDENGSVDLLLRGISEKSVIFFRGETHIPLFYRGIREPTTSNILKHLSAIISLPECCSEVLHSKVMNIVVLFFFVL